MAARGREQRKPQLHMPRVTCSLYDSEAGFWCLFCIRHLEIQLESIYIGLAWGRGEWWLPPGWFWLVLAHSLCCLDPCKAVFGLRGSDSLQTAFWGHCCREMTGPQCSSFAFEGMPGLQWMPRTRRVAGSRDARVPITVPCGRIPPLACVLLPLLILLCGGVGCAQPISEGRQSPGPTCPGPRHPNASTCGSGCWSLPYNTLSPAGLHKCDQGQFAFGRIQGKERFETLSRFSIICQHCLQ